MHVFCGCFFLAPNSGGGGGIVPALAAAQTGDLGPILGNTGGRPGLGGPGGAGGPVPGSKLYSVFNLDYL